MVYRIINFTFDGFDGIQLSGKAWLAPVFDSNRVIVIHHGLGEHCERYTRLVEYFDGKNFSFFGYDARGHGKSGGRRGDAETIYDFVYDLEKFLHFVKSEYQVTKPFLLGHSFGGLIATLFCLRHTNQEEILSLLLSAPAFTVPVNPVQKVKELAGRLLYLLKPDFVFRTGLNPDYLSHDKSVVEAYKNDPLVHDYLSVRLGIALFDTFPEIQKELSRIKIPVWIAHSKDDRITGYEGSQIFFQNIGSEKKTFRLYSGLYHELFFEISREPVQDLLLWIEEILNP